VNERVRVHHFERTSSAQRSAGVAAARLGGHQAQNWPQSLPTAQHAVTHGCGQVGWRRRPAVRVNLRQPSIQSIIHPMAGLLQIFS